MEIHWATLWNKMTHRFTTYHLEKTINQGINDRHFVHLDEIAAELYDVKSLKKKIRQDLLNQMGINVYLNSKLHKLNFFYLFLKKYTPD